jgi:chemotaxis protein MotD
MAAEARQTTKSDGPAERSRQGDAGEPDPAGGAVMPVPAHPPYSWPASSGVADRKVAPETSMHHDQAPDHVRMVRSAADPLARAGKAEPTVPGTGEQRVGIAFSVENRRFADAGTSALPRQAGERRTVAETVTVVAQQSIPAPYPISQTGAALVTALASGAPQPAPAAPKDEKAALPVAAPTQLLKIELHPAELGAVTASLRLAGQQLSIEIRPESQEAYHRLSADSETIVQSLQGLGFAVDKVTVLQPALAAGPAAHAGSAAFQSADGSGSQGFSQAGSSGAGGGEQRNRQLPGNSKDDGDPSSRRSTRSPRERVGGGLFI